MPNPNKKFESDAKKIIRLLKEDSYSYLRPDHMILKEFGKVLVYLYDWMNNLESKLKSLRNDYDEHKYNDTDDIEG